MQTSPISQSSSQVRSSTSGRRPPAWLRRRRTWPGGPTSSLAGPGTGWLVSVSLGGKLISGTTHRLDQLEAELRPEPPDADVDDVRTGVEIVAPDGRQQLVLAHRLARVLHELAEQQELQPGQGHRARSAVGLEPADVEDEIARPEHLACLVRFAAQLDPYPGQQFLQRERLGQVVVRAEVQAADLGR